MINLSEDRILDFLDGRLATPDEEELLHTLAVSPERRQVMREHMKLRELTSTIARQDRFAVPERVTSQLFSRLEEAGFTPPVTPESILSPGSMLAPEAMSMKYAGAAAVGAGSVATALSTGWRFGAIGLLTASVMSFVLGAGAYYVFGSTLGLRTHSQELAAMQQALHAHHVSPGLATQYAVAQSNADVSSPVSGNASGDLASHLVGNASSKGTANTASILPMGLISQMGPMNNPSAVNNSTVDQASAEVAENATPIMYTAPKQDGYALTVDRMHLLNGPAPIFPNAIPAPLANDRGTISVRYGAGQSPSSTNSPMSSLNEFRFGMTMWNYVLVRASMGQMNSFERTAQHTLSATTKAYEITTPESQTATSTTMMGLETGITLDPLGIPIDALVGFMYSGAGSADYSPLYGRASLMAHFEPWKMLEISAGLEGMLYTHYLGTSINNQERFYGNTPISAKALSSETCGLVGPALELGWHF